MNNIEKYELDRVGYLVIRQMLTPGEIKSMAGAVDELEQHALENLSKPPHKFSPWGWGGPYHQDPERGYHASGQKASGKTLIIEDFWNATPAFDMLINHAKTMGYIRPIIQEPPTINNSEIRIRYPHNATSAHMGGPIGHKYRYAFSG